ncbi:hypothetical protein ES703_121430 [subsurface metagenome]
MVKNNGIWKVGELSYRVIKLLGLSLQEGSPIYIGKENIRHIKKSHLRDFQKYGKDINKIISFPTYVSRNPKKNSIEYIKVYEDKGDYVLVAVRSSSSGILYIRTLFIMSYEKIAKYWIKKVFKIF